MCRVCRPKGFVGIIDIISPDSEKLAERYNDIERLRDPTHTTALNERQLVNLLQRARFSATHVEIRRIEVEVERWMRLTKTDKKIAGQIRDLMMSDCEGGKSSSQENDERTGMDTFIREDSLFFFQRWAIITAEPQGSPEK